VKKLTKKYGVYKKSRSFTPWSNLVSMLDRQLSHAFSLNDVCDGLKNHNKLLSTIRGALSSSRNELSYANKIRNGEIIGDLFWSALNNLKFQSPGVGGQNYK